MLAKFYAATQISDDDILENDFDAKDWVIKAQELHAVDDWAVTLSTLELLEAQKHDELCQPALATEDSSPNWFFLEKGTVNFWAATLIDT